MSSVSVCCSVHPVCRSLKTSDPYPVPRHNKWCQKWDLNLGCLAAAYRATYREKEIGSIQGLKYDEGVRVVETRSRSKQEEAKQSNSAGGKPGRNTSSSTVLLDRTILSSYSDLDLAKCQKSDQSFTGRNILLLIRINH